MNGNWLKGSCFEWRTNQRTLLSWIYNYVYGLMTFGGVVDYYIDYCETRWLECRKKWFENTISDIAVEYNRDGREMKMKGRVYRLMDEIVGWNGYVSPF